MISFYNSHNRQVFSNPYRNSLEIMSRFGNISWDPNNPTYERTSRAPKRKQLSASIASKANYNPIYEQIIFQPSIDIPKLYQLQYIIDAEPENAKEAEDLVKQYIERIISTTEPEIDMLARKKVKLSAEVSILDISANSIPNGQACYNSETVLLWEVESNKQWVATRDKLLTELALQLVAIRNKLWPNDDACQVIGLYFPFQTNECVVEITLQWLNKELSFHEHRKVLRNKEDVEKAVREAYRHNLKYFEEDYPQLPTNFSYPLSTDYLNKHSLNQIESGDSVVLANYIKKEVYKHPMSKAEFYKMKVIMLEYKGRKVSRIALPLHTERFDGSVEYFVFNMYGPPLMKEQIKANKSAFVHEVIAAVQELHDLGLAHLDIRIENICVNKDFLVLIDLERSEKIKTNAGSLYHIYGHHEMYQPSGFEWTVENLDWKQVGLMFKSILTDYQNPFITRLIDQGK